MQMAWDPAQYNLYATERNRPFFDLVNQVRATSASRVADLGCGTGELTASLCRRWPNAEVLGIDSSAEMLSTGAEHSGITLRQGDAADFDATGVDVLISNALLQWVPSHDVLLAGWAQQLNCGGWIAVQVPANFDAPSHVLMRELADSTRWSGRLGGILRHADAVLTPLQYLDLLAAQAMTVTVWQTEYLHVLQGEDPVLEWVRGTGLRPVLAVLNESERAEFVAEYARLLRQAYPARDYGTIFGFTRTFVVGHKP
jgi:trans-aconitate 2-methyltransferase